jgi:uncharacterized membrane protein YvbJ
MFLKKIKWRGWGQGGEMNQALYAHMNNKRKMKKKKKKIKWSKLLFIFILVTNIIEASE